MPGGGLELADVAEVGGGDAASMKAKILEGNEYRATGETNMNDASSRSHAILTFKVSCGPVLKHGLSNLRERFDSKPKSVTNKEGGRFILSGLGCSGGTRF